MELIIVIAAAVMVGWQLNRMPRAAATPLAPKRVSPRLAQLTAYADRLYREKKWLAAEKAYWNVLKLDHKNLTAYSHLGIIYSTQKNYTDAIEYFGVATQIMPSAGTYQNLGLAFYENRNYIKAIAAFEKAIMFEPSAPRYIALSKAYKKLSNSTAVVAALENAAKLDGSKRILELLAEAYEQQKRTTEAAATYRQILELDPADQTAQKALQKAGGVAT